MSFTGDCCRGVCFAVHVKDILVLWYCRFQKRKFQELQEKFSSGTRRYRKMKKRGHFKNK